MLLEQYLPDGVSHPFADTMIKHFSKLNSPIQPAMRHPTLENQRQRFLGLDWPQVKIKSLWSLWNEASFISAADRQSLDRIESFDEWEEFMLFASHYFILTAENSNGDASNSDISNTGTHILLPALESSNQSSILECKRTALPSGLGRRRHGAGFILRSHALNHQGGHGPRGRLDDADVFIKAEAGSQAQNAALPTNRHTFQYESAYNTITQMQSGSHLLVGGRISPDKALTSCYFESGGSWKKVDNLPAGRYRHCSVAWGEGVMVIGGKLDSASIATDWLYWEYGKGWSTVAFIGDIPPHRFGACATALSPEFTQNPVDQPSALIAGGIGSDGCIVEDAWQIDLMFAVSGGGPMVRCWKPSFKGQTLFRNIYRLGACMISQRDTVFIVGGVGPPGYTAAEDEVLSFTKRYVVQAYQHSMCDGKGWPRPLLIGHGITAVDSNTLLVYGGGATCFSFGSCWNGGIFALHMLTEGGPAGAWEIVAPNPVANGTESLNTWESRTNRESGIGYEGPAPIAIERQPLKRREDFEQLCAARRPIILQDLEIGECVTKWSVDYLTSTVGPDKEVIVHSAGSRKMSFLDKNFSYIRKPFGEFMRGISAGHQEYMRAISASRPMEKPTRLEEDFPQIAADFQLPPELEYVAEHARSSPLRIAGPVAMWLHYDVGKID